MTARKEMLKILAKHRLHTARKRRVPDAANSKIRVNEEVLMFREKPAGKWAGLYRVHRFLQSDKIFKVDTRDRLTIASIDKIKLYQPRNAPITTILSTGDYKNGVDAMIELDKIWDSFILKR